MPVLTVRDASGTLQAVVFGYACHATVLDVFYKWCGDYPGYAQAALEEAPSRRRRALLGRLRRRPGAASAGNHGADRRLRPAIGRRGRRGARRRDAAASASLATSYEEIPLRLGKPPSREELHKDTTSSNPYVARLAERLLAQLERENRSPDLSLSGPALAARRSALAVPGRRGGRRLRAAIEAGAGPQRPGSPATRTT